MFWLVLLFVILITVARARADGREWVDIIAYPSRWLYYIVIGGIWGPTFSACVGLHVRDGVRYLGFWNRWRRTIDTAFYFIEPDHCAKSLKRCEEYLSGRQLPPEFRWGHQATTQRDHKCADDTTTRST